MLNESRHADLQPQILTSLFFSVTHHSERALLIGGTRGIGFGTAQALVKAGAHVTIVGRSKDTGSQAVSKLEEMSGSGGSIVEFIPGDIGTICNAYDLIHKLHSRDVQYDYAVVTAATFPDWSRPLQNEDGMDHSFAIAVVGRFLMYRNMHRFMNRKARILNVLASGQRLPPNMFSRDVATGKSNVTSLIQSMMTFALGNEIMIDSLFKSDSYDSDNQYTMVSTHPGLIKTDLHRGQGIAFDILEDFMVRIVGISEEEAGLNQASILVSEKLHPFRLTLVDLFGHGKRRDLAASDFVENNREWLWPMLTSMERPSKCTERR